MLESIHFIEAELPWFLPAFFFLFGAIVGSFLNVCIYRIPAEKSIISPGSTCACGAPIAWYDNIPVLSWFILRGKARCCGRPYSFRYPAIEALTGALFAAAWIAHQDTPLKSLCIMVLIGMLICGSFIDFDHMEIPNRFSIGLAVVGVFLSVIVPSLHFDPDLNLPLVAAPISAGLESVLGLLIGSGVILWIALLAEMALKKEAMGFGDVKLLGGIGAFVGWQGALFAIFGGAVIGTLALGLIVAIKKAFGGKRAAEDEENPLLGRHIPFGPMLSSGALVYTLLLETEVDAYFAQVAFLFQ